MAYTIDSSYFAKSKNQRIRFLVLHYTAVDFAEALPRLTQGEVSAHYLIPEEPNKVYQLVNEQECAYHAGVSYWQGRSHLNDSSIGIELVNLGFQDTGKERHWFCFNEQQIETVIDLAKEIIHRYHIDATHVVGHSDIAPDRKLDPGPLFPWQRLSEQGVWAWPDKKDVEKALVLFNHKTVDMAWLQKNLKKYGYRVEETGQQDQQTQTALQAFQLHF